MSIIDKLIASLKFKKSSEYIVNRINELNIDLDSLEFSLGFITNDTQDSINYILLNECIEVESDCKFSIALIKGKINALKPVTTKQEEIKKEIIESSKSAEDKYTKVSADLHQLQLLDAVKLNATI